MGWSAAWPAARWQAIDVDNVINDLRSALVERNGLVPTSKHPANAFARWNVLVGEPEDDVQGQVLANFQYQVEQTLLHVWPYRWWDSTRSQIYLFADLCQDAIGQANWTHDLTGVSAPRTPATVEFFDELYETINLLDRVRILPSVSETVRHDSVYRLMFGIGDWATERAATFALFDGVDDGVEASLAYDVGMGGEVYDDGFSQQWFLESRRFYMTFATGSLSGYTVRKAWIQFTTEAPTGAADYSDTFTAEVLDNADAQVATFASGAYGAKSYEIQPSGINTAGDSVIKIKNTNFDTQDRAAWTPPGPNYTSTYREGLAVAGPVRLIVQLDFDYE
ncbi:MAG TPA: hypothetical protein VMY35_12225 [Phycisphaerae bacterium]|nr:hypothetical protein [Phycisphaerae bacterium]